jgi:hypothetical protein
LVWLAMPPSESARCASVVPIRTAIDTWDAFRHVDGTKPDAFIAALEHFLGERITDDVKPRVIANDLRALSAAAQDRPSLDDVPETMRIPCLLFVGEADYSAVQQCEADHGSDPQKLS